MATSRSEIKTAQKTTGSSSFHSDNQQLTPPSKQTKF